MALPAKRKKTKGRQKDRSSPVRKTRGETASQGDQPGPSASELRAAYATYPIATAITYDGIVAYTNEAFDRALGLPPGSGSGKALTTLLPPIGEWTFPRSGEVQSYLARVEGITSRVDLAAAKAEVSGKLLVTALFHPILPDSDTAADEALLALSRDLAEVRAENEITQALARALEVLFPARAFAIRLVDPGTLALTTLYARGRLRSKARNRMALRRAVVEKTGLLRELLDAGGVVVTDRDEPLFEDCEEAMAVPLAVGGQLFGILNLEYQRSAPGSPQADGPLLEQVANHAALGVRNLRGIEELTYLKTYLEDLIEHANALIAVVNRELEVVVWNGALVSLTGSKKDEALGETLLARVQPQDRGRLEDAIQRGFSGESLYNLELRLKARGGGEARVALNTAPIRDAAGDVEGVVAIGQDLTLLRALQATAEHAERLADIGRLVAGVVHELNNPLTVVNMYTDALLEKLSLSGQDPADLEKIRAIHDSGMRMKRLARDLVTYAKPTGGKKEAVDLAEVLEEAARLAKPTLAENAAVLELALAKAPPVTGNRPSLVQVFLNLIRNAAQAVPNEGRVRVVLERNGAEKLCVLVSDEGKGMPRDEAARAFEPFFTTRPGVGIGLGLPIVQGIVERHEGKVTLTTEEGKGTSVWVELPIRLETAGEDASSTTPTPHTP